MNLIKNKFLKLIIYFLVIALGTVVLTALLSVRSWYKPSIILGEVSPVSVILENDAEVVDVVQTKKAKEAAKISAVKNFANEEILQLDPEATEKSQEHLRFFRQISAEEKSGIKEMPVALNSKISLTVQRQLLKMQEDEFNQLTLSEDFNYLSDDLSEELKKLNLVERKYFIESLKKIRTYRERVKKEKALLGNDFFERTKVIDLGLLFQRAFEIQKQLLDLGIVRGLSNNKIKENIDILHPELKAPQGNLIKKLILKSTVPNVYIDWQKLQDLEQKVMDAVKPIKIQLKKGAKLATKGKEISEQNYYYLKELGMLNLRPDWKVVNENFYILSLIVLIISLFFALPQTNSYNIKEVIMLFIIPAGVSALIAPIAIWGTDKFPLIPLATISILLTVFYAPIMAGVIVTIISFFLVKSLDMNVWQILPHYVGSIYAISLVRQVHQREDLTKAGTKIALAQVIVFLLTILLAVEDFKIVSVLIVTSLYTLSGLASGSIAIAALPYLEASLNLITPFKLAELSNPNQALLKKLKEEAPGTYQHSINVGRFSEEAGGALGLNTELIRVGLLYHDIGKSYNPDYFIENTLGKPNPHTTLDDPKKSAQIIIAHVPEGIKLAKEYNLPPAIMDFIPMHQGTTITNYFYHKAIDKFGEAQVDANNFRYPGPRPNSKETGIAMMADSVEAALKSVKNLDDEGQALQIIDTIIEARLKEGELDNSGLKKDELVIIKESFVNVWRSLNHERVQYPDAQKESTN